MVQTRSLLTRTTAVVSAVALISAAVVPALFSSMANAAGLPQNRKITMSTSAAAATKVVYNVSFDTATTSNVGGLVIEFCDNSPIMGDSCTSENTAHNFNTNFATLALANQVGVGANTWSVDTTNSTATKVVLTRTVASISSSTTVSLDLGDGASTGTSITNPDIGNHTFYARILTYATAADAQGYTSANPSAVGNPVDAGGAALSTANQLLITSKVQERLTFCVYTGGSCTADTAAPGQSTIALGNDKGVLDPAGPFVDNSSHFDVTTNAVSGATIVMKGDVLKTGAFDIASSSVSGTGAAAATAYSSTSGAEQFGMCLWQSSGANLTFGNATYNNANCNTTTQSAGTATPGGNGTAQFGFNRTNLTSASGDTIATASAGPSSSATLAFIGNISNTTEAGIYQSTLTFVATGQY